MKSDTPCFEFGIFVLVPSEHVLLKAGEPVRLAHKDFELLVALVERHGRLVPKEELLRLLWPETFVEEANLTKHVSTLRKALGDGEGAGRLIETVPRVGFRFVADVHQAADAAQTRPRTETLPVPSATASRPVKRGPWIIALGSAAALLAVGLAVGVIARRSPDSRREWQALAVLPFTTLGAPDRGPDPLGIGLADGIITRLSAQHVLPVRPTSAVRAYAGTANLDARRIGRVVDADVVLEGHIQRGGDTVRVTVQLTDITAGSSVWAETFDQPSSELFMLEDSIAERVAAALRLQLAAAEQERLRRRYTANGAAYEEYLSGREALLRYTPEGARAALSHFERALALDPRYALARAGAAMASADMYLRYASESESQGWGERAEREAAEALVLDPDLAEAHVARAAVYRKREFDWDATIDESRRAITLNPALDQPHLFAAAAFYHLGLMDRARTELERGRSVGGPDVVEPNRVEALIALFSGDFEVARRRLETVSNGSSPAIGNTYLALAYYYSGEVARAQQMLEKLADDPSSSTASRSGAALAGVLAASGQASAARSALERVQRKSYRDHHVAYSLGAAFAQLGDAAESLRWLQSAAETGFPCAIWYERDPLLAPLRSRTEFAAFLSQLNQRHETAAKRYAAR